MEFNYFELYFVNNYCYHMQVLHIDIIIYGCTCFCFYLLLLLQFVLLIRACHVMHYIFFIQTLVRYQLPVVVIVFNNGGVYGGDRRSPEELNGPHKDDPAPTSFVPNAGYHALIEAFGGKGYLVGTPEELKSALSEAFSARKPAVINVIIDPYAGAESGRLQHKN